MQHDAERLRTDATTEVLAEKMFACRRSGSLHECAVFASRVGGAVQGLFSGSQTPFRNEEVILSSSTCGRFARVRLVRKTVCDTIDNAVYSSANELLRCRRVMANEWHYTLNGQPAAAPVSATQLKQLAVSGQLKPTDLVWQDGMLEWAPAGSVKGLFPTSKSIGDSAVVAPSTTAKPALGPKVAKPGPPFDWMNMHPAAVLALTIISGGIFGLIYSYKVCRAYTAKAAQRKLDAAGRTLGRVRHPLAVLMLSYLTAGIYFCYWAYCTLCECNDFLGRKDVRPRTELTLMLIFPPYALYVAVFLLPESIRRAQALAGVPETPGLRQAVFFLNPCLFGVLPLLGMLCQEALNQIWLTSP